jgi:hypothetical protein
MNELNASELLQAFDRIAIALERIAAASESINEHGLDTYEQNKS